jgi:hypothetical protein
MVGEKIPMQAHARKVKKSFSISPESEAFLRRMRRERRAASESETLDTLLREMMTAQKQRAIDSAYQVYYDSISDQDAAEQHAWGAFAETQFAKAARS